MEYTALSGKSSLTGKYEFCPISQPFKTFTRQSRPRRKVYIKEHHTYFGPDVSMLKPESLAIEAIDCGETTIIETPFIVGAFGLIFGAGTLIAILSWIADLIQSAIDFLVGLIQATAVIGAMIAIGVILQWIFFH